MRSVPLSFRGASALTTARPEFGLRAELKFANLRIAQSDEASREVSKTRS